MSLFDYFLRKKEPSSAQSAKDRLQIVIAHQRGSNINVTPLMKHIRREIIAVINKYIEVPADDVNVNVEQTGDNQVLELNVVLPENLS
ncbi:MAG: cell division topological specificity factor MinE [Candidatus Comchoanobacterales bacterium]